MKRIHPLLFLTLVPFNHLTAEDLLRQPGYLKREFIYESAPFPSCHASTLAESGGGLVTAWFGGSDEGEPDVTIWTAHFTNGQWTAPAEAAHGIQTDGTRFPCWNPVLFQPAKGPLMLFYKVGPSPEKWWGELKTSTDHGKSWSAARRLPEGILGPIKNKPVPLPDGSLLCPSSSETPEHPSKWRVHFERTTDLGQTWTTSGPVHDGVEFSAIQPSVLSLGGDRLLALGRTREKRIFQIESPDGGKTWGQMTALDLPNPSSGTDAVTLRDGRHLLIYNHTEKGRSPLNLALSSQDAKTWQAALVLEDEPGEYSYPAIIQTADGLVHLTWTWQRKKIRHAVVDPQKLALRPITGGRWPEKQPQ